MFFDTDAGGVVHNIAYLRFIGSGCAAGAWCEPLGNTLESMGNGNLAVGLFTTAFIPLRSHQTGLPKQAVDPGCIPIGPIDE